MSNFFGEIFNTLSGEEFEERPVDIEEFIQGATYLNLSEGGDIQLSHYQLELVGHMSQIYREDTLISLYGQAEGERRFKETTREITMQLGKGSGKDFTSTIAVAYVVYLLLCLKNPAPYYGKPKGNSIDIINVAINADQAQRVFFNNLLQIIENAPWFEGRYTDKAGVIEFDKNVNVYSAHSEREAFEGYNTLIVILDEISGFALTSTSDSEKAKTAPAIYDMYKGSVTSRFAEFGKLVLLSFPRFNQDFIQQKYDEVIEEKETIIRTATLKVHPDKPDGTPGNEFDISWEEDHIITYKYPHTFALKRPSWEVNPTKDLQRDYALDFYRNPGDALGRFACMPSNLEDGYFKRMDKMEEAFSRSNGVDENGIFHPNFKPIEDTQYYIHVDLAQKHDRCAVAMAHVEKWIQYDVGPVTEEVLPVVRVDALRWWQPTKDTSVDFKDVIEFIKSLRRAGFDIKLTTFDRWNSFDTMKELGRVGIDTDNLSVAKKHYDDFLVTAYDDRLLGPKEDLLIEELGELKLIKGKIDHPRKGYKDLSDAVCGAIFNCVAHTPREMIATIDVFTYDDLLKIAQEPKKVLEPIDDGVIRAPKAGNMPDDVVAMLRGMKVL